MEEEQTQDMSLHTAPRCRDTVRSMCCHATYLAEREAQKRETTPVLHGIMHLLTPAPVAVTSLPFQVNGAAATAAAVASW